MRISNQQISDWCSDSFDFNNFQKHGRSKKSGSKSFKNSGCRKMKYNRSDNEY